MYADFINEIKANLSDKTALKSDNYAKYETIRALRREGRTVRAKLMKNDFVAWVVESPLWGMYDKETISVELFHAGLRYISDYERSQQASISKPIFDVFCGSAFKEKEYSKSHIEAIHRIKQIKKLLDEKSIIKTSKYFKKHKSYKTQNQNKKLKLIAELSLEQGKSINNKKDEYGNSILGIQGIINIKTLYIQERVIECLELIESYYKNLN